MCFMFRLQTRLGDVLVVARVAVLRLVHGGKACVERRGLHFDFRLRLLLLLCLLNGRRCLFLRLCYVGRYFAL